MRLIDVRYRIGTCTPSAPFPATYIGNQGDSRSYLRRAIQFWILAGVCSCTPYMKMGVVLWYTSHRKRSLSDSIGSVRGVPKEGP